MLAGPIKYLSGIFTKALNLLLGSEKIKCILVKEQSLAEIGARLPLAGVHRLTLWLTDNLSNLKFITRHSELEPETFHQYLSIHTQQRKQCSVKLGGLL